MKKTLRRFMFNDNKQNSYVGTSPLEILEI